MSHWKLSHVIKIKSTKILYHITYLNTVILTFKTCKHYFERIERYVFKLYKCTYVLTYIRNKAMYSVLLQLTQLK